MLRVIFVVVSFLLVGTATAFETPKELVDAVYAPYVARTEPPAPNTYYSDTLTQLTAAKIERDGPEAEVLSFDPFVDGQNALIFDFVASDPITIGDRALVNVTFKNFGNPTALTLALIQEADGWKVDDVASMGVERHWLLSWLLAFDPFEVQ